MKNTPLKFPSGEFTHTELAEFNGATNQKVWERYQKAIKDGVIVSAGSRKPATGKGRASLLWTLANPNQVSTAPVVVINPPPVETVAIIIQEIEKTIANDPIPVPVAPPVAVVLKSVAEPVLEVEESKVTKHKCPVCQHHLLSKKDGTGVMVWCNQRADTCSASENPFGHGKNESAAFEILTEKWNFALGKK